MSIGDSRKGYFNTSILWVIKERVDFTTNYRKNENVERRELPTYQGACFTCPAKAWDSDKGKYFCDPALFGKEANGRIKRVRPLNCPVKPSGHFKRVQPHAILRQMLRR